MNTDDFSNQTCGELSSPSQPSPEPEARTIMTLREQERIVTLGVAVSLRNQNQRIEAALARTMSLFNAQVSSSQKLKDQILNEHEESMKRSAAQFGAILGTLNVQEKSG